MGILLCEQNFREVWRRNENVMAEIGQILHTHTHTRGSISSKDFQSTVLTELAHRLFTFRANDMIFQNAYSHKHYNML